MIMASLLLSVQQPGTYDKIITIVLGKGPERRYV
jgi:hypothetical protein